MLAMSDEVKAAVVVPCFNEAERLAREKFLDFSREHPAIRFIMVDDGSTDGTRELLADLHQALPQSFELLALATNQGKAEAVRRGVLRALDLAPYVGYWDADLSTPLEEIPSFWEVLERDSRIELVFGARVNLLGRSIKRRAIRHYLGRIFATLASWMLDLAVYDTQCGAKLFRKSERLREVFEAPFRTSWVFDVEILARLRSMQRGDDLPLERIVYEIPLRVWHDVRGSKIRPVDLLRVPRDLLRIYRLHLRRSSAWARRRAAAR
jgi:glycosyltransferase involved in cell wall biosynthesis